MNVAFKVLRDQPSTHLSSHRPCHSLPFSSLSSHSGVLLVIQIYRLSPDVGLLYELFSPNCCPLLSTLFLANPFTLSFLAQPPPNPQSKLNPSSQLSHSLLNISLIDFMTFIIISMLVWLFIIGSPLDYKLHETTPVLLIISLHNAYRDAKLIVIDKWIFVEWINERLSGLGIRSSLIVIFPKG